MWQVFSSIYFLVTPLVKKNDQAAAMDSKIPNPNEVDAKNVVRLSFE